MFLINHYGNNPNWKNSLKAIVCLSGRRYFLGIGGNSGGNEEWLDTGYTLRIKLTALVDSFHIQYKINSRLKDFSLSN